MNINRRTLLSGIGAGIGVLAIATPSGATQPKTGDFLVGITNNGDPDDVSQQAESLRHIVDLGDNGHVLVGKWTDDVVSALRNREDVKYVEPEYIRHTFNQTLPWGVDRVDADVYHQSDSEYTYGDDCGCCDGSRTEPSKVAVLDSGIDPNHETLDVVDGVAFHRCGYGIDDEQKESHYEECEGIEWNDDNGHGTHVAGIIGALNNEIGVVGVHPTAELYAVKVLDYYGSAQDGDIVAGIEWCVDNGMDVANMSLGGIGESSAIEDACNYANQNGVLLVTAAGNNGPTPGTADATYPGAYEACLNVGATNENDEVADLSNRGNAIELVAPGINVLSTEPDNSYSRKDGTSMAAPHVTAAAAQLIAAGLDHACNPDNYENPCGARGRLRDMARDLGEDETAQGYGFLDVAAVHNLYGSLGVREESSSTSTDGFTVTGNLYDFSGEMVDCGIEWREEGEATWNREVAETKTHTGTFSVELSGLDSSVTYEYRLFVENEEQSDTTSTTTFSPGITLSLLF